MVEALRAALHLTLTFYTAPYWTPDMRSDWKEATGSDDATTKVLCDYIRHELAKIEEAPGHGNEEQK
jgi:hypothetical protein